MPSNRCAHGKDSTTLGQASVKYRGMVGIAPPGHTLLQVTLWRVSPSVSKSRSVPVADAVRRQETGAQEEHEKRIEHAKQK